MNLLSIIIPTLNESAYLKSTVTAVQEHATASIKNEIIVVDTGSIDGTLELARSLGVKLISESKTPRGRAWALNRGAKEAKGDVLLFLDADTLVPVGYDGAIDRVLSCRDAVGGAFEFALDGKQWELRIVEWINRSRYRIRPHFYGDQGIFARADAFHKMGGYPERRLMEAAHFCRKLKKAGKLTLIRKRAQSSPRRFLEGGVFKVLVQDIKIWWLDLWGYSTENFAKRYWQKNAQNTFFSVMVTLLLILHSEAGAAVEAWQLKKNKDGIMSYQRPMIDSNIHEVKAVGYANASLDQVTAFFEDGTRYEDWCYRCKDAKLIKKIGESERLIYYSFSLPWPVQDRDSVSLHQKTTDEKTGVVTHTILNADDAFPRQEGKLRITKLRGFWRFTPIDHNRTELLYQQYIDAGGYLPTWLMNRLSIDIPYHTVQNLRAFVENEKRND